MIIKNYHSILNKFAIEFGTVLNRINDEQIQILKTNNNYSNVTLWNNISNNYVVFKNNVINKNNETRIEKSWHDNFCRIDFIFQINNNKIENIEYELCNDKTIFFENNKFIINNIGEIGHIEHLFDSLSTILKDTSYLRDFYEINDNFEKELGSNVLSRITIDFLNLYHNINKNEKTSERIIQHKIEDDVFVYEIEYFVNGRRYELENKEDFHGLIHIDRICKFDIENDKHKRNHSYILEFEGGYYFKLSYKPHGVKKRMYDTNISEYESLIHFKKYDDLDSTLNYYDLNLNDIHEMIYSFNFILTEERKNLNM